MKKRWTMMTALTAAVLTVTSLTAAPLVSIEQDAFKTTTEKGFTRVFQTMSPLINSKEEAEILATNLFDFAGVDARPVLTPDDDGNFVFVDETDASASFRYTPATGDISFFAGTSAYMENGDTPGLPGKEEAVNLALNYLDALNLMPSNPAEMVVAHIGGLNMGIVHEDGTTGDYNKMVSVYFSRKIDGIEVTGPGSKIIVHLGADGALTGIIRRWSEVKSINVTSAAFVNRKEAIRRLNMKLTNEWNAAFEIECATPELVIFDDGHGVLECAYAANARIFHELAGHYTTEAPYLAVVPAVMTPMAWYAQQETAAATPEFPR